MYFKNKYYFLSNMAKLNTTINYNDLQGDNVEALYQASKFTDNYTREHISKQDGYTAKKESRNYTIREDWDDVRVGIMTDLISIKFSLPPFKYLLLSLIDVEIVEDNWWNDKFWGVCKGEGENILGKIIMSKRDELIAINKVKLKVILGDLYKGSNFNKYDYIGFTANSVTNNNGELVMGKGNALTIKQMFPHIPKELGRCVSDTFGILFVDNIFAFQSKIHYRDNGDISTIKRSIKILTDIALCNPDKSYALPVPGIGNGNLNYDTVCYMFKDLPENVHLWKTPKLIYTGIGSRKITGEIEDVITAIAKRLSKLGFTCRTGDAKGSDTIFKDNSERVNSYLPWEKFNGSDSKFYTQPPITKTIASFNHIGWDWLTPAVQKLMSRNVLQLLGNDVDTESDFIICYTEDGCDDYKTRNYKTTGGTGLAISLGSKIGIPIYNIGKEGAIDKINNMLDTLS